VTDVLGLVGTLFVGGLMFAAVHVTARTLTRKITKALGGNPPEKPESIE
jgi:hypothetical protein